MAFHQVESHHIHHTPVLYLLYCKIKRLPYLGDSGYPSEPWIITPIPNAEANTPEARFNRSHMSARNCVERCIGVWKAWFRCLRRDRTLHYTPERAGILCT